MSPPSTRRHDLDALRVIAFGVLIVYHVGMFFNTWHWHVKNNDTTIWLEPVMLFVNQWRMPLLFFISGAVLWYAIDRYTPGGFLRERCRRLLIPLLFGMLVIVPPQVYVERLFNGMSFESYAAFYPTIFRFPPYPAGNLSWHHLWYLPYIFVHSVLMIPLFFHWKKTGRLIRDRDWPWWGVILFFLPMALSEIVLRPFWPSNANNLFGDWAQFTTTWILFTTGFGLAGQPRLWDVMAKHRYKYFMLGLCLLPLMYYIWYSEWEPTAVQYIAYHTLRMLHVWTWVVTVLAFGRRYLYSNRPVLRYATQAVYPFYIVHQTIIVAVGYFISTWRLPWAVKLGAMILITVGGCWLVYELVRRVVWIRPLFGLQRNPG